MKKVIAGLLMSATVLGLATFAAKAVNVHADTTSDAASTTNNANLTVTGGTLTFTPPEDVTFKDAAVDAVYNNGYSDTQEKNTTVSDFLGDNKEWTLTAKSTGFSKLILDSDKTATLTINGKDITTGQATAVATGNAGVSDNTLKYGLNVANGTLLTAGTYTTEVDLGLSNVPTTSGN